MSKKQSRKSSSVEPKVTVTIVPGQASSEQKIAWERFWHRISSEVRDEANSRRFVKPTGSSKQE